MRNASRSKITDLLKDAASSQKIEWMYVNKLVLAIVAFIVFLLLAIYTHSVATHWVHEEILLEDGTTITKEIETYL